MTAAETISEDGAVLVAVRPVPRPRGVVLVVHGGRSVSNGRVRANQLAVLRLRPVASAIARRDPTLSVHRLRFATRGWNGTGAAAIRDLRWALDILRAGHPAAPIVLVGHSMGGRASMQVAGDPDVAGVVGLAPWLPADDPQDHLAGVPIRLVHGTRDRWVPEPSNAPWIARAVRSGLDLDVDLLEGTGHSMLQRWDDWHELAGRLTSELVDAARVRQAFTEDARPHRDST